MRRATLLFGLSLLCMPASVDAGIYRCQGADGKTIFTSDPTACPNPKPHVLKKKVQNVLGEKSSPALRGGSRPAARRGSRKGDGLEKMWRGKRPAAERELQEVRQRVANMKQVVKACNRGSEWYSTDESGMRKHIPCNELREKYEALETRQRELDVYLAEGLEDECRRAGCQPGWVR